MKKKKLKILIIIVVDGLNDGKIQKFGQKFIDCILNYSSKNVLQNTTNQINQPPRKNFKADLNQFTFIEKPLLKHDIAEEENIQSDISDSEFNEIFDRIETDLDETVCESIDKNTESEKNKVNVDRMEDSLLDDDKEEDVSFDLLDSPKQSKSSSQQLNDTSLLDEDSFDNCLVEAVDEVEKSNTKKRPNVVEGNDWCHKKKKSNLSKFLDF